MKEIQAPMTKTKTKKKKRKSSLPKDESSFEVLDAIDAATSKNPSSKKFWGRKQRLWSGLFLLFFLTPFLTFSLLESQAFGSFGTWLGSLLKGNVGWGAWLFVPMVLLLGLRSLGFKPISHWVISWMLGLCTSLLGLGWLMGFSAGRLGEGLFVSIGQLLGPLGFGIAMTFGLLISAVHLIGLGITDIWDRLEAFFQTKMEERKQAREKVRFEEKSREESSTIDPLFEKRASFEPAPSPAPAPIPVPVATSKPEKPSKKSPFLSVEGLKAVRDKILPSKSLPKVSSSELTSEPVAVNPEKSKERTLEKESPVKEAKKPLPELSVEVLSREFHPEPKKEEKRSEAEVAHIEPEAKVSVAKKVVAKVPVADCALTPSTAPATQMKPPAPTPSAVSTTQVEPPAPTPAPVPAKSSKPFSVAKPSLAKAEPEAPKEVQIFDHRDQQVEKAEEDKRYHYGDYMLPSLQFLDEPPPVQQDTEFEDKSEELLDALDSFGVKAELLQIVRGPTITRYELQPARGVKVNKFTSLTNDIALALAARSIRIEAPIPGKAAIGIEIPNAVNDLVVVKDIIDTNAFLNSKGLTIALGKDLSGSPICANLQKMPHLLVAGTTGSGKSVCVNGLILSLLYRFDPRELQLVMIDPKQVELSIYEGIPHLIGFNENGKRGEGEIIVDPKKAAIALHQIVEIMEERYKLFAGSRVRNLLEYNEKESEKLPWLVVIIDELADLMMVASKTVETSICRIAQKARAAGIHMVVATQRPSADVITGLIKVNIPSRIAFAVSSQVDSRVILDSSGAEHLLGKGDMLFQPVEASDPTRIQGSFVSNEEIQNVVRFWAAQGMPENRIALEYKEESLEGDSSKSDDEDADDELLIEALETAINREGASASMFQTELKVGYARARRILLAMEKRGWVGPSQGSKPREILYQGPFPPDLQEESA